MAKTPTQADVLEDVFGKHSRTDLQAILVRVCCQDETIKASVMKALEEWKSITGSEDDGDSDSSGDSGLGSKRKRAETESVPSTPRKVKKYIITAPPTNFEERYVLCSHCYELFDNLARPCHAHEDQLAGEGVNLAEESEGVTHDCVFHSGELEPDRDEAWSEYMEDPDSSWTKAEYPHMYIWDCCDQSGDASGCEGGRHVNDGPRGHRIDYAELERYKP